MKAVLGRLTREELLHDLEHQVQQRTAERVIQDDDRVPGRVAPADDRAGVEAWLGQGEGEEEDREDPQQEQQEVE